MKSPPQIVSLIAPKLECWIPTLIAPLTRPSLTASHACVITYLATR